MTDRLTEQFSHLGLTSPVSAYSSLHQRHRFALLINNESPAISVREAYRLYMNPKDITACGLSAGVRTSDSVYETIRSSMESEAPIEHVTISLPGGDGTAFALKTADHAEIIVDVPEFVPHERALLGSALKDLATIQECTKYYIPLGTRIRPICIAFGRIIGKGENVTQRREEGRPVFGRISPQTTLRVVTKRQHEADRSSTQGASTAANQAIGGLESELALIKEAIGLTLHKGHLLAKFGVTPPRGILLHGPPGTGKTLLVRAIASNMNLKCIVVDGAELMGKFYGESEGRLCEIFKEARLSSPSLIFIDEIDSICSKRETSLSSANSRIVATLLTLMDGVVEAGNVFVMAATNSVNSIDPALRRPGRFDCEIEMAIPDRAKRLEILTLTLNSASKHSISPECIAMVAENAHGFVGADLSLVAKEAALIALQRPGPLSIEDSDLLLAAGRVKPSAMRQVVLEVPKVRWDEIGGQLVTKQKLREAVEWPLKHPEKFAHFGIRPPKGVLLYGPPGCSKTLLAKALATESGLNFFAVKGPELFSKWVGDSEKAIHEIFRKARLASPSIIFFDEFDAIGGKRGNGSSSSSVSDRVLSQLLDEMDGADPLVNVTVVAATNRPDMIDPALLRPGRFDRHVYVALPDLEARREIFAIHSRKMPLDRALDLQQLAKKVEGYSGAEISALCQEAAMQALKESIEASMITLDHFNLALAIVTPRTPPEVLAYYEKFAANSRQ